MKPSSKLENTVKMNLKEVGWGGIGWIYKLYRFRMKTSRALMNTAMSLRAMSEIL
jgi:hypothetical protein